MSFRFAVTASAFALVIGSGFSETSPITNYGADDDTLPPVEDWAIFTDDRAGSNFGCDQISIRDGRSLDVGLLTGAFHSSPQQLGAAPNGRLIMALDQGHSDLAHVFVGDPASRATWKTRFYQGRFIYGADVEVTFDSRYALFGYDNGLAKISVAALTDPPRMDARFLAGRPAFPLSPDGPNPVNLPSLDGHMPGLLPASIVLAPDGRLAYIVSVDGKVYTIDIDSMRQARSPIAYRPPANRQYHKTFATLSPSGRYLAIGSSLPNQVNVVDLATSTSRLVDISGAGVIGAVKFDYAITDAPLLAMHGGSSVSVALFRDDSPYELAIVARAAVPAKSLGLCIERAGGCISTWRSPALAWSRSGDAIIAGAGPIDVDWANLPVQRHPEVAIGAASFFKSCELPDSQRQVSLPNDVFTFNLIPTYTPVPSATPSHTNTPSPSVTPTASASPTGTSTATASLTPTPSPSASRTATPSPTATPTPGPIYIPLLLREQCIPDQRRVDVALVLDASLSMLEPTGAGTSARKLDAAREAASAFLDALHLDLGDQAAIVSFNASAMLLSPLSGDRSALEAALAGIGAAPQTCIVCGLDVGATEFAGTRHRSEHAAVLILLTDGRSNPQPVAEAVARAALAKAGGIRIYTVGLGVELDEAALREMASGSAAYHHAPTAGELVGIYEGIAVDIPCPQGTFWGGR